MGITLPFNDNQFDIANLTTDIFCYPEIIFSKILQECYRISHNVKIHKSVARKHVHWSLLPLKSLTARLSGIDSTNYQARKIGDFTFSDDGEYYSIIERIVAKMPYAHIDNLPDLFPDRKPRGMECLLFDLTDGLTAGQIEEIARDNALNVTGVYRIKLRDDQNDIRLSDIILGELQLLNLPFVYILNESTKIDHTNYAARHIYTLQAAAALKCPILDTRYALLYAREVNAAAHQCSHYI